MKRFPSDLLAVAALVMVVVMAAWLGVAGPVLDDIRARGVLQMLQAWQGLVGALIALAAALVVIQPVRRQLHQLQEQNAYLKLDHLRRQTVELDREELLTLKLISSVLTMAGKAKDFSAVPLPHGLGHSGVDIQDFKTCEARMNEVIAAFMQDAGSLWGNLSLRQARQKFIGNAQQFSRQVAGVSAVLSPGCRLQPVQYEQMRTELLPLKDRVPDLGATIRAAILKERADVVAQIEALEKLLR